MRKILVAVHGHEPQGWPDQVIRALPPAASHAVRILVVLDVPSPPFTSLLPAARRRHSSARAEWRRLATTQTAPLIASLVAALQPPPEVEEVVVSDGDPGRAIVERAREWAADLVVVGRDMRGRLERALCPAAHRRVVDNAQCGVFLTSAGAPAAPDPVQIARRRFLRRSPAVMGGA
jgi:nucleotide-binding universal stress UspA family protein